LRRRFFTDSSRGPENDRSCDVERRRGKDAMAPSGKGKLGQGTSPSLTAQHPGWRPQAKVGYGSASVRLGLLAAAAIDKKSEFENGCPRSLRYLLSLAHFPLPVTSTDATLTVELFSMVPVTFGFTFFPGLGEVPFSASLDFALRVGSNCMTCPSAVARPEVHKR